MEKQGQIHIYTGTGKGKTTAAVGLAVRALGAGWPVRFVQLMKDGTSCEIAPLRQLGAQVLWAGGGHKFVFQMNDAENAACRAAHHDCFLQATKHLENCRLLVLDEVMGALATGMLEEDALLDFLQAKPAGLEVVLTGRDAPDSVKALAHYITDMVAEKHLFDEGIPARKGIEY